MNNGYTPYLNYPQMNAFNPQRVNQGITWVQGIEGAKAYQLAPNSNVVLLDSEQNRMYIKTSDNIGMCSLRIFDFSEVTNNNPTNNAIAQDMSDYVTHKELTEILKKLQGGNADEPVSTAPKSAAKSK